MKTQNPTLKLGPAFLGSFVFPKRLPKTPNLWGPLPLNPLALEKSTLPFAEIQGYNASTALSDGIHGKAT